MPGQDPRTVAITSLLEVHRCQLATVLGYASQIQEILAEESDPRDSPHPFTKLCREFNETLVPERPDFRRARLLLEEIEMEVGPVYEFLSLRILARGGDPEDLDRCRQVLTGAMSVYTSILDELAWLFGEDVASRPSPDEALSLADRLIPLLGSPQAPVFNVCRMWLTNYAKVLDLPELAVINRALRHRLNTVVFFGGAALKDKAIDALRQLQVIEAYLSEDLRRSPPSVAEERSIGTRLGGTFRSSVGSVDPCDQLRSDLSLAATMRRATEVQIRIQRPPSTMRASTDVSIWDRSRSERLLSAALRYASFGWKIVPLYEPVRLHSSHVCSCKLDGYTDPSHPIGSHVRQDCEPSSDPEVIRGWWKRWPLSNIGVDLDESDLSVLHLLWSHPSDHKSYHPKLAEMIGIDHRDLIGIGEDSGLSLFLRGNAGRNAGILPGVDIITSGCRAVAPSLARDGVELVWSDSVVVVDLTDVAQLAELPVSLRSVEEHEHNKWLFTTEEVEMLEQLSRYIGFNANEPEPGMIPDILAMLKSCDWIVDEDQDPVVCWNDDDERWATGLPVLVKDFEDQLHFWERTPRPIRTMLESLYAHGGVRNSIRIHPELVDEGSDEEFHDIAFVDNLYDDALGFAYENQVLVSDWHTEQSALPKMIASHFNCPLRRAVKLVERMRNAGEFKDQFNDEDIPF